MGEKRDAGKIYKSFATGWPAPKIGDLRVWWIPQIPMRAFTWPVRSLDHAVDMMDMLAAYDDFQFANRVKGDYCNAGGLWTWAGDEWIEWENENGDGIDEYRRALEASHG